MNRRIGGTFLAAMIAASLLSRRASAQTPPDIKATFDVAVDAVKTSCAKVLKEAAADAPMTPFKKSATDAADCTYRQVCTPVVVCTPNGSCGVSQQCHEECQPSSSPRGN